MATLLPNGKQYYQDDNGEPLVGGKLYTYAAGTDTPKVTYSDADGSQNTNPIILDARGEATVFWEGAYKVVLKDAADNLLWTVNDVSGVSATELAGASGSNLVGFDYSFNYSVGTIGKWLKDLATSVGSTFIGFIQGDAQAALRTLQSKLRDTVSVKDFGAIGDGVADDTTAIKNAVAATANAGRLYFPRGKYMLTDEILLTRPILIVGDGPGQILEGYDTTDSGSYVFQTNNTKMVFKLVAALNNYAFGQYGACGIHFQDICLQGLSAGTKAVACIGVDTSINGGDFHIRGNSVTRCNLRYAVETVNFTGIAYLNNFYQTNFLLSTTGLKIARGAASDSGGQTRFFGCLFEFNTTCVSLNEDTVNGEFSFFGCTFGDGSTGISTNDEIGLVVRGCNFESNSIAGIYVAIPFPKANVNSSHIRDIQGNEFFSNGSDIWFDKLSTSGSNGNFSFPTIIDSNSFGSALGLKLTAPAGEPGFCCPNFVIGSSNSGTMNGQFTYSQISPNMFWGTDDRKREFSLRYVFTGSYVSGAIISMLPVGLVVSQVRILLTANASGPSTFNLGDIANSTRYASFNGQTQTLNTWVTWANQVPDLVLDGSNNQFRLIGTGGILSAAGVIEVNGFVTY